MNSKVEFDNPSNEYYSGSMLRGRVRLMLTEPQFFTIIYVRIHGYGHTEWTEGSGKEKKDFEGDETYIDKTIDLNIREPGADSIRKGEHVFPFEYILPLNLPSSMEVTYGHIRYEIQLTFDGPRWLSNNSSDHEFIVIQYLDLNSNPFLREPKTTKKESTFLSGFFLNCVESDPLNMKISIPQTGFVPGQTINITIETNNDSDQDVSSFNVAFRREIIYHIHERSDEQIGDDESINEEDTPSGVDQFQNKIHKIGLFVPPVPPTDLTNCKIFKIRYYLQVSGSVGCGHFDPSTDIPITIGSVPLRDATEMRSEQLRQTSLSKSQVLDASVPFPPRPDAIGQYSAAFPPLANVASTSNSNYGIVASTSDAPSAPSENLFDPPSYDEAMKIAKKDDENPEKNNAKK